MSKLLHYSCSVCGERKHDRNYLSLPSNLSHLARNLPTSKDSQHLRVCWKCYKYKILPNNQSGKDIEDSTQKNVTINYEDLKAVLDEKLTKEWNDIAQWFLSFKFETLLEKLPSSYRQLINLHAWNSYRMTYHEYDNRSKIISALMAVEQLISANNTRHNTLQTSVYSGLMVERCQ